MYLLEACAIAISMYSKIPMPRVIWTEKNMKYAMCFFPLVGMIVGTCQIGIGILLLRNGVGNLFFSVVMTLIPVLLTGGIHLDGFMDTVDALGSYGEKEKKLEILKDPRAGAFAVLGVCCYFIWNMAIWSEAGADVLPVIGCGYVLSRGLSGLSVVTFAAAKDSGLAKTFQDGAQRKHTGGALGIWILLFSVLMLLTGGIRGGAALIGAGLTFLYYRNMSRKQFGGITGDLAGYFLQVCELVMLTLVVLAGRLL